MSAPERWECGYCQSGSRCGRADDYSGIEGEYALAVAYPAQPDGKVLLTYPRLFIVAVRS